MTEFVEVPCTDCEEPVEMPAPTCAECMGIEDMELPAHSDIEQTIPESDLRELVEEWREEAARIDNITEEGKYPKTRVLEQCADELEAVLEE